MGAGATLPCSARAPGSAMNLTTWGLLAGVTLAIILALVLPGGAGLAILLLPAALLCGGVGALLGWAVSRSLRREGR